MVTYNPSPKASTPERDLLALMRADVAVIGARADAIDRTPGGRARKMAARRSPRNELKRRAEFLNRYETAKVPLSLPTQRETHHEPNR